jgi:tRNA-splicing ligase RtcB
MTIKPYKVWGYDLIDPKALEQFDRCMEAPFALRGAAMPDMHYGFTMPIGGVILTDPGYVVPSWVGYDVGCGVCYVETSFKAQEVSDLKKEILGAIHNHVPTGFSHQDSYVAQMPWDEPDKDAPSDFLKAKYIERNGDHQLGTMGGNNHFIEVGLNNSGTVCVVIHSGSRGIGHDVAHHYMCIAGGGKAREGNYALNTATRNGRDYIRDMNYLLRFALLNRKVMLFEVEDALNSLGLVGDLTWESLINNTHNHAEETYDGIIHRKGATKADAGVFGVVPGNSEHGSYIVEGRGNVDSLCSSSHGAGRLMGRSKKAIASLSHLTFVADMAGIACDTSLTRLDEAPRAYKDPTDVMSEQQDLVKVIDRVRPLVCVKG